MRTLAELADVDDPGWAHITRADRAVAGFYPGASPGPLRADSVIWEPMEGGYASWLAWMMSGRLGRFYESLRWPGWEAETAALSPRQGLPVIPFLTHSEPDPGFLGTIARPAGKPA